MKRLVFLFTAALMVLGSSVNWAQTMPKLTSITFLNGSGQPINCTSGGNVAVQLLFDRAMKFTVKPTIKYGLKGGAYNLNVPSAGNWQDTTLFQVVFNINANVPAGPDGEYSFLIFGARDSASNTAMDSTYSDSLNTTIFVYRNGNVVSNKDTVDFGLITFGRSKLDSVVITNSGCGNITINSATVLNPAHFALLNNLNGVLQKDNSVTARLRYQPTSRQLHQTRLRVIYTVNARRDSVEVVLVGRAKGPRIAFVPPGTIDFGTVSTGNSASRAILVVNPPAADPQSSDTLRISSIVSTIPGILSINPVALPLVIAPADTDTVSVTFQPDSNLIYNGGATFTTNDESLPLKSITVPLTGKGRIEQPPPPIDSLTVSWTGGYAGYTTSDTLYLCLPGNLAGVAFARWKIVTTAAPPQGQNDYTGSAVPFVSGGVLCFKIPLRGVVSANVRNYFYLWLDGTNGTSGWYNYYYYPLYYYTGAPVLGVLNFTGLWPGGFAYFTNLDSIPICWEVSDGRDIAEVRWKFSRTPNSPPVSANDTTANGGTYRIAGTNGTLTCANLLLRRLSLPRQGYWYAYIWIVDKAGNSSHVNPWTVNNAFRFKYDITAPLAAKAIRGRNIPATIWFGNNNTLVLKFDQPDGPRDAAQVRWRFRTQPAGANAAYDGQATPVFLNAGQDSASFSVLFDNTVPCGDDTLYFWLADSAGNANALTFLRARYRFDRCPPAITRIRSLANNVAPVGQAYVDSLFVRDPDSGVNADSVWVIYRLGGSNTNAPRLKATRDPNRPDVFYFTIPSAGVTRRGIEFYAMARDQVSSTYNGPNANTGPTNGPTCYGYSYSSWYPLRTRALGNGDFRVDANGNPVPLVAGDTTNSYQLISIPYNLDNGNAINTLQDDLGAYDATQWRLFDYVPQNPPASRWAEGANVRPFTPGRSFFIITRKQNIVLDSGPGVTRRTVCPDTLTVYEGWNLIASPFNFPVHKTSLRLVNANQDSVSLWSFENQWTFTDVMDAWRGYAIYVVRGQNVPPGATIQLIVQPVAVPGRIGKATAPQFAWQPGEWAVQIAAQANGALDDHNWAGVRHEAQAGYDALDMAEPPVIGGYVSVSFPRPEWLQPAENFCTDYRANDGEDQVWEFEVATNQTYSNVRVRFDLLGDFPAGAKVYVIDEALRVAQDLRAQPEYSFRSGSQPVQKKLRLVVGGQEFAAKEAGKIALVPEKFEVLQNYPNPFNPETSIRYNLSQSAPVRVEIFDQLGRRVRVLVNGEMQQSGYQSVLWDGRDEAGRNVASGIYIYKVTAGAEAIAKKMVLQK